MNAENRRLIAVCASWEDTENLNLILGRLIAAAEKRNFLPLFVSFDRSSVESRGEESIQELVNVFDVPELAGILLFGEMIRSDLINGKIIALAHRKKLPVFMLERQYEGCVNLTMAYAPGFEKVARHMIVDHGCRDLVVLAGTQGNAYSEERIRICRRLLEENGASLPEERILYGGYWDEPAYRALNQYFDAGGAVPKGFICINDAMAIAVSVYLSERGIRVPEDVLVVGFDGILPAEKHEPTITTARPDFDRMFGMMLDRVSSWEPEMTGKTETIVIPFDFIPRESCGCVPREQGEFLITKKIGELKMSNLDFSRHIRTLGNFIRTTLSIDSLERLAASLPSVFSQWPNPYYFAAALEEEDRSLARPILYGRGGRFEDVGPLSWRECPVPDPEAILSDPSIRILMLQLLQNQEETMGYLMAGLQDWTLRGQERFEEEALFLSSSLNAVLGNLRLHRANEAILRMAEHDHLTGLYNRRGFRRELDRQLQLPENQDLVLTCFTMDMDHLKQINDGHGHQEGDEAIIRLSRGIREAAGARGLCARYGGDEFAFAFLEKESMEKDADRIRERIEQTARTCGPQKEYAISASLGAASSPVRNLRPMKELFAEADQRLYADKEQRHHSAG